jgi:hypothetical protein
MGHCRPLLLSPVGQVEHSKGETSSGYLVQLLCLPAGTRGPPEVTGELAVTLRRSGTMTQMCSRRHQQSPVTAKTQSGQILQIQLQGATLPSALGPFLQNGMQVQPMLAEHSPSPLFSGLCDYLQFLLIGSFM